MKLHLDIETRSEIDLRKVGSYNYSQHHSTEILCLAYAINDGEVQVLTKEQIEKGISPFTSIVNFGDEVRSWTSLDQFQVVAHNSTFEYEIWENILSRKHDYPKLPPEVFRCTAAKASAMNLPRGLDNCAKAMELDYTKDMLGKQTMLKMCKPRKATKKDNSKWNESPEDFKILHDYCKLDVEVEREIDKVLPDLSPDEQKVFHLDQVINYRGIRVDEKAVAQALDMVDQFTEQAEKKVHELTDGALDGLSRRNATLQWIRTQGVVLKDFTKETVNEALNGELPSVVHDVLKLRQQLSKTSLAKYNAFKLRTAFSGRLYDTLLFHGSHTGRWSGMGVQPQNFPRCTLNDVQGAFEVLAAKDLTLFESFYPDVLGTLSQMLRGCLIPSKGSEFVGGDQNAIEVRVLFWLAGEKLGLKQFQNDEDLYVAMARKIFDVDVIDKSKRFVGKQTVLGCGFGMGLNGEKFIATCRKHGVTVPVEVAKRAVRAYRELYRAVVAYWKAIEDAIRLTLRNRGKIVNFGKLRMWVVNDFLYIELPSGRTIHYHQPRLEGHVITHKAWSSMKNTYETVRSWGGVFTENVVQAIARDLIVFNMFNAEQMSDCVLTVHDEILTEVPFDTVTPETFKSLMEEKPVWLAGCPIKATSWRGVRFK